MRLGLAAGLGLRRTDDPLGCDLGSASTSRRGFEPGGSPDPTDGVGLGRRRSRCRGRAIGALHAGSIPRLGGLLSVRELDGGRSREQPSLLPLRSASPSSARAPFAPESLPIVDDPARRSATTDGASRSGTMGTTSLEVFSYRRPTNVCGRRSRAAGARLRDRPGAVDQAFALGRAPDRCRLLAPRRGDQWGRHAARVLARLPCLSIAGDLEGPRRIQTRSRSSRRPSSPFRARWDPIPPSRPH